MNLQKHKPASACWILGILFGICFCFAAPAQTNQITKASVANTIKTNFVTGAQLTRKEIKQVLALAKQCGITNAGEIRTFHILPSGGKRICVKSTERVDGRNTSFDSVYLNNTNWSSAFKPDKDAKHIGSFWFNGTKYKTLLRSYQWINNQPFQVSIGDDVDIAVADKLVEQLISGKLPFSENNREDNAAFAIPDKPHDLKPQSIRGGDSENTYNVEFNFQKVFIYRFEKGEFIYVSSYSYVI